jgi:hypothetical protein
VLAWHAMSSTATKTQPEHDPILSAAARARRGAPLTDEERLAKEEGAAEPAVSGEAMTAEIARRCAGE